MLLCSVRLGALSKKRTVAYWVSAAALYIPVSAAMLSCPPVAVCKLLTWIHTSPRDSAASDRSGIQKCRDISAFAQTARASIPYVLWCFFSEAVLPYAAWSAVGNRTQLVQSGRESFAPTRYRVISYFFTAERRRLLFRRCCVLNETLREKNRRLIVWVYRGLG